MDSLYAFIVAVLIAAGVPSAIFSLFVRRFEKKLDSADQVRQEQEKARIDHEIMTLDMIMASLELAEVTAEAVKRIPDTNCNGEMEQALKSAKDIQTKYRSFERRTTVTTVLEKGA